MLDEVILRIAHAQSPDLVVSNKAFHHLLLDGVPVQYKQNDKVIHDKALLMDFNHPKHNHFTVVNQVAIQGTKQVRRPDVIGYINGLPVAVIELKSPIDANADIWAAFNQLQTYKNELGDLFICNEALVISDGYNARIGSLTANEERFLPWKTLSNEDDKPLFEWQLETVVKGFFNRELLLDYIRYFILFESDGKRLIKKLPPIINFTRCVKRWQRRLWPLPVNTCRCAATSRQAVKSGRGVAHSRFRQEYFDVLLRWEAAATG